MDWVTDFTIPKEMPSPTHDFKNFIALMKIKCFNIENLVEDDLLCKYNFCRKKVRMNEDIDDRMTRAELKAEMKAELARSKRKKGRTHDSGRGHRALLSSIKKKILQEEERIGAGTSTPYSCRP